MSKVQLLDSPCTRRCKARSKTNKRLRLRLRLRLRGQWGSFASLRMTIKALEVSFKQIKRPDSLPGLFGFLLSQE